MLSASCFVIGAWIGFWQGIKHSGALEAVSFSALSTVQIDKLKSGDSEKIDEVVSFLEFYVDHGLNQFVWYREHGNANIGELIVSDYENSMIKSVRHAAKYRDRNHEENISDMLSKNSQKEYEDAYLERQSVIEEFRN